MKSKGTREKEKARERERERERMTEREKRESKRIRVERRQDIRRTLFHVTIINTMTFAVDNRPQEA